MSIHKDRRRGRWRFEFKRVVAGARRRSTKLLPAGWSRDRAETYDRDETARLYAAATGVEKPRLALAGAVQLYLDKRVPKLRDGKNIARELAHLVDDIEATALEDVAKLCQDYVERMEGKLSPATVRNRLAYLKAAVRYAWRTHGYGGDHNPAGRIVLPTVANERHVYLRVGELKRLLAAFDHAEDAALFRMAFYTGLRWRAELLPRSEVDIKRLGRDLWLNVGTTKNGTPRMVPLHPEIHRDLKRLPFEKPWHVYADAFQRARKAADLVHVRPHDLRHSLASEIISRGGTLADVQGALHHRSVASARRYAHLYPERVKKVMFGVKRMRRKGGKWQKKPHSGRSGRSREAA